ncbi:glycoside hydrolase family 6 protein [Streptomyces sp. NBC_01283]|uniref:glycoside hydrolase family 6 protein n=1 Tax=Streptomyces sp. NBC_01283 TaxID=2903812 RepID=UPI00352E37A1|nr:glycoside hydrolase family 6 protein [Streptomyces sp. NBC_01283]
MRSGIRPIRRMALLASAALIACAAAPAAQAQGAPAEQAQPVEQAQQKVISPTTRFYVDPRSKAAKQAITDLRKGDRANALNMAKLASQPQAEWFTEGTPAQVRREVRKLVHAAAITRRVPVLVAYNVPGRDCSLYSGGGAASSAAYRQWIDAFADGIGDRKAAVVLEPDGLAALPKDCAGDIDPTGELTAHRMADLAYAVRTLKSEPNTAVYLDAGNSQWKSVGDITRRLLDAGLEQSDGFSLNVSNYQPTDQTSRYGTWIAKCAWYATKGPEPARGPADSCASQYYSPAAPNDGAPGNSVSPTDPSTWHWTDDWFDQNTGGASTDELARFVVDTSRNGLGAWTPPPGKYTGDPETWCNPPGRGMGPRPTADTKAPLVDAYLYVKTIGESDGSCTRNTGGTIDPEYGIVDPAAGVWWPEQAHTLARNAVPGLEFPR